MSQFNKPDPVPGNKASCEAIETVIVPPAKDLGGFEVRRALPSTQRQMVGPFIFWDEFGPVEFLRGDGIDVRPHPHIGLATISWLFAGQIRHRDSLGNDVTAAAGDVNVMTAGRGIVHSERTPAASRQQPHHALAGIQSWIALPDELEETAPDFVHYDKQAVPLITGEGKQVRLIAGQLFGERSPMAVLPDMLYADITLAARAVVPIDAVTEERALYLVSGVVESAGTRFEAGRLLIIRPGDQLAVRAERAARLLLFGGAALNRPRYIWWNFVSSSEDKIRQAKEDWRQGRFGLVPGDAEEFIPLPE